MRSGKRAVLLRIYPACVYKLSTLRITHWVVVFTAISEALDRVRAIDFVSALGRLVDGNVGGRAWQQFSLITRRFHTVSLLLPVREICDSRCVVHP
jgi:hypothetical protein